MTGSIPVGDELKQNLALSLGQASEAMFSVPEPCPIDRAGHELSFMGDSAYVSVVEAPLLLGLVFILRSYDFAGLDVGRLWKKSEKFSRGQSSVGARDRPASGSLAPREMTPAGTVP